jgi:hypothetical protein
MMAHTIIPVTWEVEIRRIKVRGQSQQNITKTPLQLVSGHHGVGLSL